MTIRLNALVATPSPARLDSVDALRGLAMVWMTLFHFGFDLQHFGYWRQDFYVDPFWTWQRTVIVSLFLFCAGLGQALAVQQGQGWRRFGRRWAQVAGAALLVSVGSWLMFPRSYIYFGVLHGLAVMLVLARLAAVWETRHAAGAWWGLTGLGALAVASAFFMPPLLAHGGVAEVFDSRALNWIGWITHKPVTEDFVPLFPWLGVVLWGVAAGGWLSRHHPTWLRRPLPMPARALAWLGRWSLSYYLLHQPVLIGLLMAVSALW